ncbi:MAG: L-threonylcarbamoyladenylate synthase [Thermosynechococcaceae cyanobacterium]
MPQVSLRDLVAGVQSGRLIGFPTDTVPALAAQPTAAAAIYAAKQRSSQKPLILMGATPADLWPFVQGNPAAQWIWERVAHQYWPGAITLVLPASDRLPKAVNPDNPTTIGLRVPNWPLAQDILRQTGPLATTSLNRSDQPPLEDLAAIAAEFPTVLTPTAALWQLPPEGDRVPSTVAQWTGQGWSILRQGAIVL